MLILSFLIMQGALSPPADTVTGQVYHGFREELDVRIPSLAGPISIDGLLDEAVWAEATILTGFSQYSPADGVPAADSTEVRIWYSEDAIYFGIRAWEPHGRPSARLSDRDRIQSDDHIQILLDTFNDGRRAWVFGVNALGIQADGIRTEATSPTSGGLLATRVSDPVDLSPDFLFESHGRITDYGYDVEVRIPFQSLRFPDRNQQVWGINIVRHVQHSGQIQTWTPALRGRASFLAQSGTMHGITGILGRQVLDINPTTTVQLPGERRGEGWAYPATSQQVGVTARWGITPNLTIGATANPDFSQIEADANQINTDPRRAVFLPEKRPFFLEGSERFQVPNRLIHTRRIVSPDGALKLTGKVSQWDVGLLTARDAGLGLPGSQAAYAHVARVQRDIGDESTVGIVYTNRQERAFSNQLVGADMRINFRDVYTLSAQTATSATRYGAETSWGSLWDVSLRRSGRELTLDASVQGMDPTLVAANGFLSRVNTAQARFSVNHTRFGAPAARMESWTRGFSTSRNWLRAGLFGADRHIEDWKTTFSNNVVLAGGWRLGASFLYERFFFPPYHYEHYAIERPLAGGAMDTTAFTGVPHITNYDLVLRVATPRYPHFSGNLSYIVGMDENFDEWAPGFINIVNGSFEWRPNDQVRIEPSYLLQHYKRPGDMSTVAYRSTPRLKAEYQATRAIFVRVVGQYHAQYRDALRDDAGTQHPILMRDAAGVYVRAGEVRSNRLGMDWLFSFQPQPGTVIFAGYGTEMTEPTAFRFRDWERVGDQFFVKFSYLFRR